MPRIMVSLMLMALGVSCASLNTPQTGVVHYINIGESVSPKALRAKVGDEVRWVNLGRHAVRLHLVGNMEAVMCQRGFGDFITSRIGSIRIAPHDFVSLCLGKAGEVKFHIQREDDEPKAPEKILITDHGPSTSRFVFGSLREFDRFVEAPPKP
jgi:hypothetical protein